MFLVAAMEGSWRQVDACGEIVIEILVVADRIVFLGGVHDLQWGGGKELVPTTGSNAKTNLLPATQSRFGRCVDALGSSRSGRSGGRGRRCGDGHRRWRRTRRQKLLLLVTIQSQLLGDFLLLQSLLFNQLPSHFNFLIGNQLFLSQINCSLDGIHADIRHSGQFLNGVTFQIDCRHGFRKRDFMLRWFGVFTFDAVVLDD